jgi:hypothetical protein
VEITIARSTAPEPRFVRNPAPRAGSEHNPLRNRAMHERR